MNRAAFEALNHRHRVESARYFSQRPLMRKRGLPAGFGLCAALVDLWWEGIRTGRDPFDPAGLPTSELVVRQARHAYPAEPFDPERASDADRALLTLKYGAPAPRPQSLAYDLEALHGAVLAESRDWIGSEPGSVPDASDRKGLRLLLLRYHRGGHRMAFVRSRDGRYRFFDPNAGEVAIAARGEFAAWFADFWEKAGYARRAPRVTLYRFTTLSPVESAARES